MEVTKKAQEENRATFLVTVELLPSRIFMTENNVKVEVGQHVETDAGVELVLREFVLDIVPEFASLADVGHDEESDVDKYHQDEEDQNVH